MNSTAHPDLRLFKGSRKKGYFFSGPATKWERGEGKGLSTKKNDFFKTFFHLVPNRKLNIFCFKVLLQYLAKNMSLLVQKFCGDFFLSEFVSDYFKTKKYKKKVPFATKLEGGVLRP